MNSASHEFLDHTSEVRLHLRARTVDDVYLEAGRALANLLVRGSAQTMPDPGSRTLRVESVDRVALLVDWLNELLFVAEVEGWIGTAFEMLERSDQTLRVRSTGVRVSDPPTFVKAATLHGASIREVADGVMAEVIFDV